MKMLARLLLVAIASAAAPTAGSDAANGGGGSSSLHETAPYCSSDADCSLSGVCTALGACLCDPGWGGAFCSVLIMGAVDPAEGINHWASGGNSWGGVAVADPAAPNLFHFFYSRFVGGCGLLCWVNASEIVRAVGPSPAGPFTDAAVIAPVFAHNPTVRRAPDGTFVLWLIGQADPGRASCL